MLMAGTAFATSISCAMTPIAHTFPLMALGFYTADTGETINYMKYMSIGVPVCLLLFVLMVVVLGFFYKDINKDKYTDINIELPKISKSEIISGIVFLFVVLLWISPEFIKPFAPTLSQTISSLGTTIPAMIGVVILSVIKTNNKPILDFKAGMKDGVAWNSIILCATTLCVGGFLTKSELGITNLITNSFAPILNNVNMFVLVFIIAALVCVMTNLMSNIVTTTVTYAIVMPIIFSLNAEIAPIITILIGMNASLAFATPPAIAHIAIASGSEWTTAKDMLKYGGLLTIIAVILSAVVSFIFI